MRARRFTQIGRRIHNSNTDMGTIVRSSGAKILFTAGQPTIVIDTTVTTQQAAITFKAGQPAVTTVKDLAVSGAAIAFTAGQPTVTIDNPPSVSKVFQLTPATIQQSGGSVTSWDDDIASYDFTPPGAQPTVASAALNGYDVVSFDYQSSQCLLSGYTPVGSLTLLVVAKFTSVTSSDPYNTLISCHLTGTPDGGFILHDDAGGSVAGLLNGQTGVGGYWVSGMLHQHSAPLDTNWHVYGLVVGAAETKLIIDSVVHTDSSHGSIAAGNPLRLGHDAGTSFFDGQIAEVVYWDDDLGTDLATEIAVLQTKYGL